MKDWPRFTNFMALRDLSAVWVIRNSDLSLREALELHHQDILIDDDALLVSDNLLASPPRFVKDYQVCRNELLPKSSFMFPTFEGKQYYPGKFTKRLKNLLADAGAATSPVHPAELSEEQYAALLNYRFCLQRPRYQEILAVTLCTHLGLRPSEVAKLIVKDLDFDNRLIILRDTKSQMDQMLPMLSMLYEPLKNYVRHLSKNAPLFVNASGFQWDRRDVTAAVSRLGKEHGLSGLNARKMRASLGSMLVHMGIPPALLAKILRHKDPATALRHYSETDLDDARRFLEKLQKSSMGDGSELVGEFTRIFNLLEEDKE